MEMFDLDAPACADRVLAVERSDSGTLRYVEKLRPLLAHEDPAYVIVGGPCTQRRTASGQAGRVSTWLTSLMSGTRGILL